MMSYARTSASAAVLLAALTLPARAQTYDVQNLAGGGVDAPATLAHDLDGDGDRDVVFVQRHTGLGWLENEGGGRFPRAAILGLSGFDSPTDLERCDCDGDGDVDYALSESGFTGRVSWIERDGGAFVERVITTATGADALEIADLDGDGDPDLVAAGAGTVRAYFNDGAGTFSEVALASSNNVDAVDAEDLDGDGDPDVAFTGAAAQVLYNDGGGTFTPGPLLYTWYDLAPNAARDIEIVDFNGDGVADLLTFSDLGTGGLYFLDGAVLDPDTHLPFEQFLLDRNGVDLGGDLLVEDFDDNGWLDIARQQSNGGWLFLHAQSAPLVLTRTTLEAGSGGGRRMDTGDFDGDGDPDLVFPANGSDLVLFENAGGDLYRHLLHGTLRGAFVAAIGDLDGDGDADVAGAMTGPPFEFSGEKEVFWYENRGDGTFTETRIEDAVNSLFDLALADMDGDGRLDVVATIYGDDALVWYEKNGLGWTRHATPATDPKGLAVADLDADGDPDVVVALEGPDAVHWYENDGTGTLTPHTIGTLNEPVHVAVGDFDSDADADVAAVSTDEASTVVAFFNDGGEGFARAVVHTGIEGADVEAGDWTGDGRDDIAAGFRNAGATAEVTAFAYSGGAFTALPLLNTNWSFAEEIALADAEGDGDPDLVARVGLFEVAIVYNVGGVPGAPLYIPGSFGDVRDVAAGDVDGDGLVDFALPKSLGDLFVLRSTGVTPPAVVSVITSVGAAPVVIPPGGGPLRYRVTLRNTTAQSQAVEAWVVALLPNGSEYGPVQGPQAVTLNPGQTLGPISFTQQVPGSAPPGRYTLSVRVGDHPGTVVASDAFTLTKAASEAVAGVHAAAAAVPPAGAQAHPNPFGGTGRPATTIHFALAEAAEVRLAVYDVLGREVAVLVDDAREAGEHAVRFDAGGLASGFYLWRLETSGRVETGRLTLLR